MKSSPMKILAIVLISAGILGLAYQGFTYEKTDQVAKIGSLELTSQEHKYVSIPPLVSAVVLGAGVLLLFLGARSKS